MPRNHTKDAACHHSTLNTFGAVVAILEGGLLYDSNADVTAERIIKLCRAEMQRQLRLYDAAISKAAAAHKENKHD